MTLLVQFEATILQDRLREHLKLPLHILRFQAIFIAQSFQVVLRGKMAKKRMEHRLIQQILAVMGVSPLNTWQLQAHLKRCLLLSIIVEQLRRQRHRQEWCSNLIVAQLPQ